MFKNQNRLKMPLEQLFSSKKPKKQWQIDKLGLIVSRFMKTYTVKS
jgi:hypothetical protein